MPFDPVCGRKLHDSSFTYEYHGKTYYFCSEECLEEFSLNPARYVIESGDVSSC